MGNKAGARHTQKLFWLLAGLTAFLPACREETAPPDLPEAAAIQEAFAESNKRILALENEAIADFIQRFGWEMQQTGSGLRVKIRNEGRGEKASYGQRARIRYTVYLLTGDPVYSSEQRGPLEFTVGRGGVERGLEEGILLLREGAEAVFIMPSHLAHGLPGDGRAIPKRATIVYELELLELQ